MYVVVPVIVLVRELVDDGDTVGETVFVCVAVRVPEFVIVTEGVSDGERVCAETSAINDRVSDV